MYEFTKREAREKFKKTDYGKKTNTYILISYICFFLALALSVILTVVSDNTFVMSFDLNKIIIEELSMSLYSYISYGILLLSIICLIYFDGKRDGAIKSYMENNK